MYRSWRMVTFLVATSIAALHLDVDEDNLASR